MSNGSGQQAAVRVERALVSVWRKDGLAELGRFLRTYAVEVLSTGGTASALREGSVPVRDVSEVTGFPELMDGRVKTLHPRIHGGILFRRDLPEHGVQAAEHAIPPIDLVIVDLYPFEEAAARDGVAPEEVVEMIDIGGPAMIRSAAKNHAHVTVITDVDDLAELREEMEAEGGAVSARFRRAMASKAFRRTAAYDAAICRWMDPDPFPERLVLGMERKHTTRYGENPHQKAAVYMTADPGEPTIARAGLVSGRKELSYNNYLDASAALELVRGLGYPAAVVVKHRNPCGAAQHPRDLVKAFQRAYEGDPRSAFGGIVAFNRPVEAPLAREVADPGRFLEVLVAPEFTEEAVEILTSKVRWGASLRLLACGRLEGRRPLEGVLEMRSVSGGVLVQERDAVFDPELEVVTARPPEDAELADLRFAWEVVRHVVSNAVVLVKEGRLVGCGAGQMSRVDAVEIAARKAGERARGAVLASDAFFPFPDGVEAAGAAGVRAVIQPGGSRRDEEVVAACDRMGMAMVITRRRHFRH